MSLARNIAANYLSQFYVALVGVLLTPTYLRLMSAEGYGLVAFFTMVQAWFQLMDFGMTATVTRETARLLGGAYEAKAFRLLLRSLEGLFWSVGFVASAVLIAAAPAIATRWLNVGGIDTATVVLALQGIGITVGLRWISGLYRGLMTGLERQVWLGTFNAAIASLRFIGVIPVLFVSDRSPVAFFAYQAIVSVVELTILVVRSYSVLPGAGFLVPWTWAPLRSVLGFSATVAFTSLVWVVITQADKTVVSMLLPLGDYGLFSAAVLIAGAITLISGPLATALLPRLTRLSQERDEAALVLLYRQATQAIVAMAGSAALVLALLPRQVLWAWSGNERFADDFATITMLYAVGNGLLAVAAFPYYLQYAKGNLRLHLRGNLLFVVILAPAVVFATMAFGVIGAGATWLLINLLFFLLWTPLVHSRFVPGLHAKWIKQDVLNVIWLPICFSPLLWLAERWSVSRAAAAALVIAAGLLSVTIALLRCDLLRPHMNRILSRASSAPG